MAHELEGSSIMNQMIRLLVVSSALGLLAISGACTVQGGTRTRAAVYAPAPNLVAIGGGVYVVENYSQPVFYADGYYWRAGSGGWYRSSYYDRGWGYVDYGYVPPSVVRIRQPRSYVRFRARPGMSVHRASAIDHRRRRARPMQTHRRNTHVPAVRGRPSAPTHRTHNRSARPARPAARAVARPARAISRPPARHGKPVRRGKASDHRKAKP